MPIHVEPPEDEGQIEERVVASIGAAFGPRPTVTVPYAVERLDLADLAQGNPEPHGGERWQCLVGDESEPIVAVDVIADGGEFHVVSVNRGTLARRFSAAIELAEAALGDRDLLLSQLEAPGLDVAAVRLVDREDGSEYAIPAVFPDQLEPLEVRVYEFAELLERLRGMAEGRGEEPVS
jgi:hypothetical protein